MRAMALVLWAVAPLVLLGCAGAWTLHPSQIEIAKRVFSLDPAEGAFAKRIVEGMPDGSGA